MRSKFAAARWRPVWGSGIEESKSIDYTGIDRIKVQQVGMKLKYT